MTTPSADDLAARRAAAAQRLSEDVEPVDVFLPWAPVDTSGIDPDIRESTPAELAGRRDDAA